MNGILGSPQGMGVLGRPLGAADPEVKTLQTNVNHWLATHGFQALKVDGVIGPRTCGAARQSGTPTPAGCTSFTAPTPGNYPWNVVSADTKAMQAELAGNYPTLKVDGVLGPVTCGAAKAMSQYGIFVPGTCRSFTAPSGPSQPTAAPAAASAAPVDWAALAAYAAAVKTQNDKRAADLVAYAQAAQNAKNAADMIAYANAVKAANDKRAADLIAYANAVKAAQAAKRPRPKPPSLRSPVPKPPAVMQSVPPPDPLPPPPDPALEPAHASAEVAQAGMSNTTKLAIGLGAAALVGYMVFFRKKAVAA
jgi:hypothetical protein